MSSPGSTTGSDDFEFGFADDGTGFAQPSWYKRLLSTWIEASVEMCTKSLGLDVDVWMKRIVVTMVIVLAWDYYWTGPKPSTPSISSPPPQPLQQQEQQKEPPELQADQQTEKQPAEKEPIDEPDFGGDEIFRDNDRHRKREEAPTLAKPKSGNGGNSDSDSDSDNDNSDEQQELVVSAASSTPSSEASPGESETKSLSSDAPTTTTAAAEAPATANEEEEKEQGSEEHPGMAGFLHWYEVETSLYRIYTLERKDPTIPAIPPYVIGSHRGRVPVELVVTNTTTRKINVSWVDYKGKHVPKGQIQRNHGVWKQTTWIDHPWVFEDAVTGTVLLYYVPYKVIPTIPEAPTMGSDVTTGLFRFSLIDAPSESPFHIGVSDQILPVPKSLDLHQSLEAINWTLLHLSRAHASSGSSASWIEAQAATLQKYLVNILNHPDIWKYRNLSIASKRFGQVWNSPCRGLLLAVGCLEHHGACTLGSSTKPLVSHRVQDVALLSYLLSEWQRKIASGNNASGNGTAEASGQQQQPRGASDGFGRAGFGRAGEMR